MFGSKCNETCGSGCVSGCDQITGHCTCKQGWENDTCVGKQSYNELVLSTILELSNNKPVWYDSMYLVKKIYNMKKIQIFIKIKKKIQ